MNEYFAISGMSLLVVTSVLVQHINTVWLNGASFVLTDRSKPLGSEGLTGRSARALQNNIESAVMFIPLAFIVIALGASTETTILVSQVYLGARIGFSFSYWLKQSFMRSSFWVVSMLCIGFMAFSALNA